VTAPQKPIYEGKAKQVFPGPQPDQYLIRFKDSATAFNAKKKAEIEGKGVLNHKISSQIFQYLEKNGVKTHYVKSVNDREMVVKAVTIIPLEVVVRNLAAGSLCKRYGIAEKTPIDPPIVEFFYKQDSLDDPLITDEHIRVMKLATPDDLSEIRKKALRINELMRNFFKQLDIILVDFKLEFGRDKMGEILLADEISPDGCRLWDAKTLKVLDKDRFRKDMGGLKEAYEEVFQRMGNAK
jgi:phosphoribosylaminoimidazole-succinocarboxamide synthase